MSATAALDLWRTPEARKGLGFSFMFFLLAVACFIVSELSSALVLQLNSFQLLYRSLCTASLHCMRTPSALVIPRALVRYPFGVGRADIVLQFAAATMLLFASLSVMVEAVHHLLEPHDTQPVLVEVICFTHFLAIVTYTLLCQRKATRTMMMNQSLWVFVLIECRAPLICFLSCSLVTVFDAARIDVACAFAFAVSCVVSSAKHAQFLVPALLLEAPVIDSAISDTCRQVALVRGVIRVRQLQLWLLRPDAAVGSVKLVVDPTADGTEITARVRKLVHRVAATVTVELERGGVSTHDPRTGSGIEAFPAPPIELRYSV